MLPAQPINPATAIIAAHLDIHGQVQGVGYRLAMLSKARELQLQGWVRNKRDGRVEALVQGPADRVAHMLAWCQSGPPVARVRQIKQHALAPDPQWTEFVCRDTVD
ncbi:MAG: acylphosphatase [Betaproteobacteria bacterium]